MRKGITKRFRFTPNEKKVRKLVKNFTTVLENFIMEYHKENKPERAE